MLTEHLQCKALEYIYSSNLSKGLVLMDGTALRIFYGTRRFSEDLDFDSADVSFELFKELMQTIGNEFRLADMHYIFLKQGTDNRRELADRINTKLSERDIHHLASDLALFRLDRKEFLKVELFPEILRNWAEK